jgi:hypothetical protein
MPVMSSGMPTRLRNLGIRYACLLWQDLARFLHNSRGDPETIIAPEPFNGSRGKLGMTAAVPPKRSSL